MEIYILREKLAYSRIARAILRPLTAKGCRTHWLQQSLADLNMSQVIRFSKLRVFARWTAPILTGAAMGVCVALALFYNI